MAYGTKYLPQSDASVFCHVDSFLQYLVKLKIPMMKDHIIFTNFQ